MVKKIKKKISLKNSIIYLLVIGWMLPVLILAVLLGTYVDTKTFEQTRDTILSSLGKAGDVFEVQMNACETASKNASYYSNIRESYLDFQKDGMRRDFESTVTTFLGNEYKYNQITKTAILIFPETGDEYYTYNNSAGGSYKDIATFVNNHESLVLQEAESLGTKTSLMACDGRVYMVRNMILSNFEPYAVLTLEVNEKQLFESFDSVWGYQRAVVLYDGNYLMGDMGMLTDCSEGEKIQSVVHMLQSEKKRMVYRERGHNYAAMRSVYYGKAMDVIVELDRNVIYRRVYSTYIIFGLMLLVMIPLFIGIFHYFRRNITQPIDVMVQAYDEIATQKNYGYRIEKPAKSKEFAYMEQSFNQMSAQIREQFDRIVSEEIALRDAKIMALQSQINPHFLNNTFEIINWEARLNGNYKVSKMIEALSTMLEATMNRRGEHLHALVEEMSYVDAYAYIISERLGDKFIYAKEIENEKLLDVKVPKLMIQPIVENAVEHGLSKVQKGHVVVRIYEDESYVYIDTVNDGALSSEDEERIHHILNESIDPSKERSLSLGIRNVNNRLKLIYGESCGLTISNLDATHTVSSLRIRRDVHSRLVE